MFWWRSGIARLIRLCCLLSTWIATAWCKNNNHVQTRSVSCGLRVPERDEGAQLQWVGAAEESIQLLVRLACQRPLRLMSGLGLIRLQADKYNGYLFACRALHGKVMTDR